MHGKWYLSRDEESFHCGPFDTRDEAVAKAPDELSLDGGETFWSGQAVQVASRVSAGEFCEMLDQHAIDDGPDGNDGYEVSAEAKAELDAFLSAWEKKHDIRPRWFDVADVEEHVAPVRASTEVSSPP